MVRTEPTNDAVDNYFCPTQLKKFPEKSKRSIKYADTSVSSDKISPTFLKAQFNSSMTDSKNCDDQDFVSEYPSKSLLINQTRLNDLVRDLNLPIDKNYWVQDYSNGTFYRRRQFTGSVITFY